ncbi:MAG: hypothetical protein HY796_12075 [Elusimicrobia bacterium]|nr:hypothetical protein [Elusimicrobiota bacterium]
MRISRYKLALALFVVLGLGAGAFAYVKYKNFSQYLIEQINSQADKKLGRQVKFKKIAFSPLKGIIVDEPCVSRAPDFSKGNFFCAKRAVIRPEISKLMNKRLCFANVEFEKPVIKAREAGGKWDFEDLLALLPKTSKGLHLTWNAKRLTLKDATVEIDIGSSGQSLALENADITLLHYSALAGNFELTFSGDAKTILNNQLLTTKIFLKTGLNFEYAGLTSAFGGVEFTDAVFGAATLKKAGANWELFNINKPAAEKNYAAGLKAEGLFIPARSGGLKKSVNSALGLLSSVMGKEAPRVEDLEINSLTLDFTLNDRVLRVKRLDLDANFLNFKSEYELNGPACAVDLVFSAQVGANKFALTARGPMDSPEILPAMSYTLAKKLLEAVRAVNARLLKIFPVATERPKEAPNV